MSLQRSVRGPARAGTSRLVLAAFVVQASVSILGWFMVNDRSRGRGVWVNSDVAESATLSISCAALLVALSALVFRHRLAPSAVAVGCVAAAMVGLGIFTAWAVLGSA